MDFPSFLLECCRDNDYNDDGIYNDDDDDGISKGDLTDNDLSLSIQSTAASDIYATPERPNIKRRTRQQLPESPESPINDNCNPNIYNTLSKSTSSTPIRCREEEDDGYIKIKSKRRPGPVVVDIWEEQQQQQQQQQQQREHRNSLLSAAKATPATAKTATVSPFQDSSLDDDAYDCVENSIALPHQPMPQDDLFVADFGAMDAAAAAVTNSPQRDLVQDQQRMHFQRVLSFSSATASAQQQQQQQQPQEGNVTLLPTPSTHEVLQTPTSQLEKQRERPLVPPSAVAGARRRMPMIPPLEAIAAAKPTAEEEEETATTHMSTTNMSTQEDPIEAPLDEHERKSVVSALVAKMNAASSAFTATTATLSSSKFFVHENTREDQDDEWSQDSLLNLTDDDEGNGENHDLALVEESFTDLQKDRKPDAFELFPRHENIFVEPGAKAAIINMAGGAVEEEEEEKDTTTSSTAKEEEEQASPPFAEATTHEPEEAVDEVFGGQDSGNDEFDQDFEDDEDSEGLPIIFDDEFGDLPEGAIFNEEDFGLQQQSYGIYHQNQPSTTLPLPLAPPKAEEEKKQEDEESLPLVLSSSKSNKKKKKKGGSLKKKFTKLLQRKKVDYGSLNEDSFEKSNNKKELPQSSTTSVAKKAAASVPVKKAEASSVPVVKPAMTPIPVPTRTTTTTAKELPPAVTTVQSEDSFAMIHDPWSTETTTAAFPMVKTEPTKLTVVKSPPASPIKQSKLDTPPIHNAAPLSPKKETTAGGAPSWEQLLTSVLENNSNNNGGDESKKQSSTVASNDPWMIPDSDIFEAQKDQEQEELKMTAPIDSLPFQFTNEFFSKPEASSSSQQEEAADQEAGPHAIPLDTTEQQPILEESSPTIDTATAIRPSQVIPKRRVTGVNNTKAIFENSAAAAASSSKRSLQVKRTSTLVSPDKELPQDAAAIKEANKPSVQDLTDAFDKERSPKWVNRKVKAWEQTSEKTEQPTPTRKSRVAIRVVSGGDSTRSASLPKRVSNGGERSNVALPDKDLPMPPKRVNMDGERGTSVQALTDAFDTERTPKMVNRKVKAFERGHTSEKPETSTRRLKVAIHVVDKTRSSSLTKRDSRGGDEAERSSVRSSSLTKRVPPKSSPPLPSKPVQPVQPVNPIEVPRKEKDSTLETTTRRSSNVGQMASIFDPPTVSKKNVNKLAGAFEKETKVFHKPNRIPSNNKAIMSERPVVKRSFSSNAIPAKAPVGPTATVPKRASVVTPTNAERTSSNGESSTGTKKLFSYWEQVAVTTKSTPMPSAEENVAVVVVDEQGSNKDMGVDVSFDFSDPDYESSGVRTVDEKAWAKATSNQPESATIFSL